MRHMTMTNKPLPVRLFDPHEDFSIVEGRNLPHWTQAGALVFITWRTADSMPRCVIADWVRFRNDWLERRGIDPTDENWRVQLAKLPRELQDQFQALVFERWESRLDECHGKCVLRCSELSGIVADSLLHFDGDRYVMADFVVMPNHVHVLAAFPSEDDMKKQCDSWKHYTAVRINRQLKQKGRFWAVEDFDHLVRSEEQLVQLRQYIADNARNARLREGEYWHYSRSIARSD
jgi:hypothetical protein